MPVPLTEISADCPLCGLHIWSVEAWILHRSWHQDVEGLVTPTLADDSRVTEGSDG
jgi:hypothetical protein